MRQRNSLTRLAGLVLCTFIVQGVFWGLPSLVAKAAGQEICNDGIDNDGNGLIDCADPACASPACPPPNIILIVADDMGWGDLCANSNATGTPGPGCNSTTYSYYCDRDSSIPENCTEDSDCISSNYSKKAGCYRSNANTPRLDNLAQKGIRLTNFYTPTPVCSPARASLLTGKHPFRHGATNNQTAAFIRGTEITLAEALKENITVYSTGVIGKWHLGWDYNESKSMMPHSQGFDYYYTLPYGVWEQQDGFCLVEGRGEKSSHSEKFKAFYKFNDYGTQNQKADQCPNADDYNFWSSSDSNDPSLTQKMTDKALEYIRNNLLDLQSQSKYRTDNAPFFLYLAYPSPHSPIDLHVPNGDSARSILKGECEKQADWKNMTNEKKSTCMAKEGFKSKYLYYQQALNEIDKQVGLVLDCLKGPQGKTCTSTQNIYANTIVIFASDNGPFMGSNLEYYADDAMINTSTGGLKGGKQFTFEGGIRVPFIVRWPNGYLSGFESKQPADLMDIFTTLLTAAYAANGKTPSLSTTIDGKDLSPVLSGNKKLDKTIHSYSPFANIYFYGCANPPCSSSPNAIQAFYDPNGENRVLSSVNNYKLFLFPEHFKKDKLMNDIPYDTPLVFSEDAYSLQGLYQIEDEINKKVIPDVTDRLQTKASVFRKEAIDDYNDGKNYVYSKYFYYFPSIKDNDLIGWANYIDVRAKDEVPMDVKITVYDMAGIKQGTYIYSDTDPAKNEPSVKANAKAAQRPCWIAGTYPTCTPVEGSVIVETSVPAIASTNTIANYYKGFDIYEAAKPRSVHTFGKNYDGPGYYQVYILVQNIYSTKRNVTVKLLGGAAKTWDIPAFGTEKIRPSDIAGGIDFNGSVVVYSNLNASEDGLGPPIPAVNRQEAGTEALTIYESSVSQPSLAFPHIRDGKFGGSLDYQNFLSVVNPSTTTNAKFTIILYNNGGIEEGRLAYTLPPGGKDTWRPSWIKGTLAKPSDFEGSIVVTSDIPVIGQTNVLYSGSNKYGVDAFAIYDSATPASTLFFPKIYDNRLTTPDNAHLTDNYVYIQNPEQATKNILIEQFNADGKLNGTKTVALGSYGTHVYRPYILVTDGTATFRGSVKVTEKNGLNIAGVVKYELHLNALPTSGIGAMTVYRSMGQ